MKLPRWTVYPAVLVLGVLIFVGIPMPQGSDPYEGAAAAADGSVPTRPMTHAPVVVLGIDGMDPDLLKEVIQLYPERMENFRWLIAQEDGIQSLGTSTPPQSPVAWSNFITGQDPGGHGIFDFLHRDRMTRAPIPSTVVIEEGSTIHLPGKWQLAIGADSPTNRTGRSFWSILADHGVPADIWRMPINFPVEPSNGVSFPGMMTPALDSAYGECSFYTTDPMRTVEIDYDKLHQVTEYDGKIVTSLQGPGNPFRDYAKGEEAHESIALTILVDREANAAVIDTGLEKVILQPGQWSHFLQVDYEMLPLGAMNMSGICRFYLRSIEPEVELYASPVNLNPENPPTPVSAPDDASVALAEGIGRYYTQGMAEDVNSLKKGILTDAEFMAQVDLVYRERRDMLEYALDSYLVGDEGGLLFFYFSTVDLTCHMMWRHFDASHPAYDPEIANQDSSWWSHREGSTWKDTVYDLYLKMDPVLGRIRARLGDDVTLIVMSDHGFAPYRRMFSLNTWLLENGYLVLHEGKHRELERSDPDWKKVNIFDPGVVDWSRTRAYGVGFNGLYLNLEGREEDNPETDENESGIVPPSEVAALLAQIRDELVAIKDPETGQQAILRCDLASEVYTGERLDEAPDMLVGFNAGYGNADSSSLGRIPCYPLEDNSPAAFGGKLGTFNGSHLMAPEVVSGVLISNRPIREGEHQLEDLTVELLQQYGVEAPDVMLGHRVLE
jgi:predicted AlkP superfamily phosphohydrolase/phosphomutase